MKLIYSYLKRFLPSLDVAPQKLRDDLTMIGHFANYVEDLSDGDFLVDLDIKVNRGDPLGYYGLARDLSVLYNIPLANPEPNKLLQNDNSKPVLPIDVTSADVTRVMAVKISGIKVSPSPDWLVNFLKGHEINSINNIVDLTNYVMLMYGIPNHAFDTAKTTDHLIWENNNGKTSEFITLDGTTFKLSANNLVISNPQKVLSTDFVGGQNSGVDTSTTDIIIEVAIYNKTRVRKDAQEHQTRTEAGIRLEKALDPNLIPQATSYLAKLIQQVAGGQISSQVYDYYPNPVNAKAIEFDPQSPSIYSGIDIPADFALDILKRLGCTTNGTLVTPPTLRHDLEMQEDLIEEVVRFWGYDKIPTNQPLSPKQTQDITPPVLSLIELLKDKLTDLGYDEVRTWPLTDKPLNPDSVVKTQNSINSEYPYLRQSIIQSLEGQLDQYMRYKLPNPQFFEIDKVFSQSNGNFEEHYSLGLYNYSSDNLKSDLDKLGLKSETKNNFAEVNLEILPISTEKYIPKDITNSAYELTHQIITLDANVTIDGNPDPKQLIKEYSQKIGPNLWQLTIIDIYQNRYTFRVSYFNMDDKSAKDLHLKSFNL